MNTINELNQLKTEALKGFDVTDGTRIVVGMATCGISAGAIPVLDKLIETTAAKNLTNVKIVPTGCIGTCIYEPIVEIFQPGKPKVTYIHMDPERVIKVVDAHLVKGAPVVEYTLGENNDGSLKCIDDLQFYKKQKRVVLHNCGLINPEDIYDYVATDGYQALAKVLTTMKPEEVIELLKTANLRGRGGAGFPTGVKWSFAAANEADQKYIVCNADEGDPGAFMDRSILEGDPHSIIEAMTIGGYAIGASKGFMYVRAEYPIAVERLKIAIDQATEKGFLGKNIFGSGFDFDIEIRLGAGAFVCGEETALIASIEGKRGMSRNKPPFPAHKGLWGKPTIINNVETLANIPKIILNGSDWFKAMGTEKSPGTKVFALGGKINNTGLVEVAMGITLREVVYDIGEDCLDNRTFKAVQTGGPSGGCVTTQDLDTPIDFDNLEAIGSMMGSGGMIVMDEDNCMVDIARFFLDFTVDESCGKCTPCREGTKRMLEILEKITEGNGTMEDLDLLESLAENIANTSLCALGQTAPNPVLSTMKHFRDEYIAHVVDKKCPASVCKELLEYFITDECNGCTRCVRVCPTDAITGKVKELHVINQELCTKCGACMEACRFNAIIRR